LFTIKDKIYYEIIHRLLKLGKTYVPRYFIRGMTGYIKDNLKNFNQPLIGIEIGSAEGENAKTMFNAIPIRHLYCIDPYDVYTEVDIGRTADASGQLEKAKKNLKEYLSYVTFIKDYSYNCINQFEDVGYDFVYIDGNHDYDCVKQDIELYYPKVRSGGILGGHDFGAGFYGIVRAVQELCNKYDYVLYSGRDGDWWIVKK